MVGRRRARVRSRPSAVRTRRISVSGVDDLASASLSFSDLTGWGDRRSRFLDLTDEVWRVRGYGDFWSYCLVAEGAVDIAAEPEVKLWDLAPIDILVREAGGSFTNFEWRSRVRTAAARCRPTDCFTKRVLAQAERRDREAA